MKTNAWLVRAASLAVMGSLGLPAAAAKPRHKPKKPLATAPAEPTPPAAPTTPEKEEDGPFAPTGKTGKLREEPQPEEEATKPKPEQPPPPPARPKLGAAGADIVFGFGKMGGATGPDAVELSLVSFLFGGTYQVNPQWGVRMRVPVSTGKITYLGSTGTYLNAFETAGQGYNAAAFGNIELAGNYTFELSTSTKLPLELAFALPTAGGDRFPPPDDPARGRRYRVNAAASASRGFEEEALFEPHRIGFVPAAYLRHQSGPIQTGAFFKVPILVKVGGQEPPPPPPVQPAAALNPTMIMGILGGDFHYGFVDNKIDVGARAWASLFSNYPYDILFPNETAPSKFQLVFEPQVRAAIGPVRAILGFVWPLCGRLGKDQQVNGLRLSGAYVF